MDERKTRPQVGLLRSFLPGACTADTTSQAGYNKSMPDTDAQLRATLMWEAACEKLRNALHPRLGAPAMGHAEFATAIQLAQQGLDAMRDAFEVEPEDQP
jgi:hypothetical protein